jgi:hypothetical protein
MILFDVGEEELRAAVPSDERAVAPSPSDECAFDVPDLLDFAVLRDFFFFDIVWLLG